MISRPRADAADRAKDFTIGEPSTWAITPSSAGSAFRAGGGCGASGADAGAAAGIAAVIQPGGSVRDDEVIAAADEHGIAMVFTGMRHFRH